MHWCFKFPCPLCEYIGNMSSLLAVILMPATELKKKTKQKTKGGEGGKEGLQLILSVYTNMYFSSCLNLEGSPFIRSMLPYSIPKEETKRHFYWKRISYVLQVLLYLRWHWSSKYSLKAARTFNDRNDCCNVAVGLGLVVQAAKLLHLPLRDRHALFYWMTRRDWQHSLHCKSQWHTNL